MSWQDKIQQPLVITTGDGKVYSLLWKNAETSKEFNTAEFVYINLSGAEIARKKVKARKFPLLLFFQGDDNIEQADAFDLSANDPRAWKVQHPLYGTIIGQPLAMARNDVAHNVTEVTVDFWETISNQVLPKAQVSIPDATADMCQLYTQASATDYAGKVAIKPADVSQVTDVAQLINAQVSKVLTAINYNEYQLAANAMFASITNLELAPTDAIRAIHGVLLAPARFDLALKTRISLLGTVLGSIIGLVAAKPTVNNKAFYESAAGAVIGAMALAMVNPLAGDYNTRSDIAAAAQVLSSTYTGYLQQLDAGYVSINDPLNAFSASNASQTAVQTLVISTIVNLNTLAFSAKQERIIILDKDSNLIVLTHKYMGLDALDANMETFRQLNNIRNNELFLVKKGRQIKYLV